MAKTMRYSYHDHDERVPHSVRVRTSRCGNLEQERNRTTFLDVEELSEELDNPTARRALDMLMLDM